MESSVKNIKREKRKVVRANHRLEVRILGKKIGHFNQIQSLRLLVQLSFLALIIWIGYDFLRFVKWTESGGQLPYVARPQGVEGFLPISALISLKYWIFTGIINNIHPASLVIFLAIVGMSFVVGKSFCSWVCPVGLLSESFASVGEKFFGRNFHLPRWLDYPLRSLKYLLLLFFLWAVFVQMDVLALKAFIESPYNRVADIKMLKFFQDISPFALWTLAALGFLSIFVKHFWCRYLCPYGALLGIVGIFSPLKITRNIPSCIDCKLCTKVCPAHINVHKAKRVLSDECTSCLTCIDACPVADTLFLATPRKKQISPLLAALAIVLILPLAMLVAKATGHWYNTITKEEYLARVPHIDKPLYQHNRGQVPVEAKP